MNRRHILKLAAATVATPTLALPTEGCGIPEPRDGETWESLAESMAHWERSANRDNFRAEWRFVRERGWIPWNHRHDSRPNDQDVTLVYLASPERSAAVELVDVLRTLHNAGVCILGNAVTNCHHVATAFVSANYAAVEAVLAEWYIARPPHPREHWTAEEWAEAEAIEASVE